MSEPGLELSIVVKELLNRNLLLNQEIQTLQDLGKEKDAAYYKLVGAAEECNLIYHILKTRLIVEASASDKPINERHVI